MKKILLCIVFMGFLTGCAVHTTVTEPESEPSVSTGRPEPAYDRLSIYSALPEEEILVYLNAFRKDTGITVDCQRLSAGEMIERVQQERENPRVSVILGGAADHYVQANEEGLLIPYQSPELSNVPEPCLDQAQVWNPIYIGVICFACNEDWFLQKNLPYPTCWDDLTAPELEGKIVLASPETSGTSYTMLAALMQQRGEEKAWEYLQMLDANVGCYTHSGIEPVEKVKQGEFAVGIVFSHDGRRAALDGYPVMLCYPEDGTGYEIGACALVRGGPVKERENAERFIDWMTSQRGQECYIEAKSSRLPANSTARSADGLPAMKDIKTVEYDLEWAGSNRTRLIDEFQRRFPGAQTRKSLS